MSSLIFEIAPDSITVATDTLVTTPDGEPAFFTTKATYIPHLRTVIAGTGIAEVMGKWAQHVNDRMLLSGIRNLEHHAPDGIQKIWQDMQTEYDLHPTLTTTIYHVGISEEDQSMYGFVSRSTDNFASEPMGDGWRMKPECSFPEDETDLVQCIQRMMI